MKITNECSIPRVAFEWKPAGHRKRGRPRMTWSRSVEAEVTAMGHSWGTLRTLAQDRLRWRDFVAALVVYDKGWYAQRRCTFTLERNADLGRRAMLLNAENSGIPAATQKLIYTFVVHTTQEGQ